MILRCTCVNPYQDKRYGKGLRVVNPTTKGNSNSVTYRCTVCEALINKGISAPTPGNQ